MNDAEVIELYGAILGREPETADTIAAFRAYYADYPAGRLAILRSAEFARLYAAQSGPQPGRLATALLRHAGGAAPLPAAAPSWAAEFTQMLCSHGSAAIIVNLGGSAGVGAAAALGQVTSVLVVEPDAPAGTPQLSELPGGTTLFRWQAGPAALAGFLAQHGLSVDALVLEGAAPCGHPAAAWLGALAPHLSARAVLLHAGGAGELAAAHIPHAERLVTLNGAEALSRGFWFLPVTYTPRPPAAALPMPRLCIAAIMRNEANAIANMIASSAAFADSYVILDTGSTDASFELAEAALQQTGRPYLLRRHPGGRFDDMRNAALDLVPDATQWVLMLDADEELVAEDAEPLAALLARTDADAWALPRYNFTGADKSGEVTPYPDRQVRLLRHGCGLRYSGAVHETVRNARLGLAPLDASALGQGAGGPHIHHLVRRFRSPAAEAAKQEHYRTLAAAHKE